MTGFKRTAFGRRNSRGGELALLLSVVAVGGLAYVMFGQQQVAPSEEDTAVVNAKRAAASQIETDRLLNSVRASEQAALAPLR